MTIAITTMTLACAAHAQDVGDILGTDTWVSACSTQQALDALDKLGSSMKPGTDEQWKEATHEVPGCIVMDGRGIAFKVAGLPRDERSAAIRVQPLLPSGHMNPVWVDHGDLLTMQQMQLAAPN